MPNIKPISDLRNYSEVLRDVAVGAPVFLTKNGRGRYAIVDMQDYEKTQATLKLMNELAKGRRSGEEDGWLTSEEIENELYTPCLKWAERFDRGVGYFTTGWLTYNVAGLSDFASRGGKMRLITSPILSTEDTDAIIGAENQDGSAFLRLEAALLENVEILKQEMEADIINTFSWMLYDGIIDMRFAIPCEKLEEGDFHDKFGIFYKGNDALSFSGSINDSKHGFQNYESIKVFKTWAGTQEYVDADTARFEKIWNRKDRNLKMFTIPQAVKNKIFELRSPDRPYSLPAGSSKWVHQDIAVKTFLEKEHGILAMATGTGKTVTAMKIINKLFDSGEIRRVVITSLQALVE